MNSKLVYYVKKYKNMIANESYEPVVYEMISDLKELLLHESVDIDTNYLILETFYDINNKDIVTELNELENLLEGSNASKVKSMFIDKHEKITQRDKKWLEKNKKKLLALDFEGIELEVLSDYKVTFEQLLNRHNIFDKIFVNSDNNVEEKIRRFKDKNDNLKNGLDNYFRTGTSRREIGLRKVQGDEAKLVVENMIAYCESFLSGRQFLEDKMNSIIVYANDMNSTKESLSPIELLKSLLEASSEENKEDKNIDKKENKEEDLNTESEEENAEQEEEIEAGTELKKSSEDTILDRQTGVTVLITVAEERYFDYINILKGLIEE